MPLERMIPQVAWLVSVDINTASNSPEDNLKIHLTKILQSKFVQFNHKNQHNHIVIKLSPLSQSSVRFV